MCRRQYPQTDPSAGGWQIVATTRLLLGPCPPFVAAAVVTYPSVVELVTRIFYRYHPLAP